MMGTLRPASAGVWPAGVRLLPGTRPASVRTWWTNAGDTTSVYAVTAIHAISNKLGPPLLTNRAANPANAAVAAGPHPFLLIFWLGTVSMGRAGTPAQVSPAGSSVRSTEPMPSTASWPTDSPSRMLLFMPR